MTKTYTGYDRDPGQITPGLKRLVEYITFLTGNELWNNGTYAPRPMRGKTAPSVHGTGRAVDLSWRKMPAKKGGTGRGSGDYNKAVAFVQFLVDHADLLHLEIAIDYHPKPHGRAWRCDRGTWNTYTRHTVSGAPGGDWFHLEISPRQANNAGYYDEAFATIFNQKA
jgi:hypothetical protein